MRAILPTIEGEFRAVSDPVLKFGASGAAYCSVRAVADKKKKNEASGEWEDDKIIWVTITCFKRVAENMAESVVKGTLMQVKGQVESRTYEKSDGTPGFAIDIAANSVALSLAFDAAHVVKTERASGGGSTPAARPAPAADPWATTSNAGDPPF